MTMLKLICIATVSCFARVSCDAQVAEVSNRIELNWIKKASDALYWSCARDTAYADSCASKNRNPNWSFYSKVRATHSVPVTDIMSLADSVASAHGVPSGHYDLVFGWSPSEGSGYTLYSASIHFIGTDTSEALYVTFSDYELYLNNISAAKTLKLPKSEICGYSFTMIGTIRKHELSTVEVVCHE